ncbi:MFS transporter [candidate division WOR-3 bacterium]|nr:MFS transporter [candidate division WOR-3 bacterium]
MLIAALNQLLWITFAPITGTAAAFYGTTDLVIGLLSMSFMVVYIIIVLPSAWVIDTWGLYAAVGIGAGLTALGALGRGVFASNLTLVFASQIAIALGQPFILGAITKLAARWFPLNERATASGLGTLAIYLGILLGMILTPILTLRYEMRGMLLIYGIAGAVAAAVFLILARERPPTPPCPAGLDERALMFDGLKSMLRQKDFILLMVIFFIGLGMFNGVTTWIEAIVRPRGFTISQAGLTGGLMLIGGILGALVIPMISDKIRRRKPFIILALTGLLPGLAGVTFVRSYWLLLVSGFLLGFFLLSSGPIGFQYGAEITHPAPEGTSNSLLLVMGQLSGIIFIFSMEALKSPSGSMTPSLIGLTGLMVLCIVLALFLKESPISKKVS